MLSVTLGATNENLNKVYSNTYISSCISHDDRQAEPIIHDLVQYYSAWVNDTFAGCFMLIKFSTIEYEVHSLLFKEHLKHSRDLAYIFLDTLFKEPIERVTAYIIEGLETAKNFCLKIGFKQEGVRRNACKVNGRLKDIYVLGMTRKDRGTL
jgi:hypothetical protein